MVFHFRCPMILRRGLQDIAKTDSEIINDFMKVKLLRIIEQRFPPVAFPVFEQFQTHDFQEWISGS